MSSLRLVLQIVAMLYALQMCEGSGKIEVKFSRFQSDCDEHLGTQECDIYFYLCIDKPGDWDMNSCFYKRFGPSGYYENDNSMTFDDNIRGISNPLVADATRFDSNQFMFVVEAKDKELFQIDEPVVTMGKTVSYTPKPNKAEASWSNAYSRYGSNHIWFFYRSYCDPYYYTTECDVYCKARDNSEGHYTCIEGTGQKKCIAGWKGDNCSIDINECDLGPCYHNASCTNTDGSYQCDCPQGYTGRNCDLVDSMCHSSPCQNGGTCSGTMQYYSCVCPYEWTGNSCETQVDFCQSNPCQNNATCYGTVGNYTCSCSLGWTGYHCTTEVNACESSPCQNSGNCTNLPQAEYSCSCPAQYEGDDCDTVKNPCDPNPCINSGTCNQLTYTTYNCTCVYGWEGATCENYLNVTVDSQQQEKDEEHNIVIPIVMAFISAIIIVICVLILLFLRRRRRQKKAAEARLTTQEANGGEVIQVAGRDNMAFGNALYDETNRANSARESQGSRAQMPVPPTPTCSVPDDVFYPTKPSKDGFVEEEGAVGGANPYQDIDGYLDPKKCVELEGAVGGATEKDGKLKQPAARALDTRTLAGGREYSNTQGTSDNPYADFEDLKRRSVAAREATAFESTIPGSLDQMQAVEENHYHDLDDICLDIKAPEPINTGDVLSTPTRDPSSFSHYDLPRGSSGDVTPAVNGVLTPPGSGTGGTVVANGYMPMAGNVRGEMKLNTLESDEEEEEGVMGQEDIEKLRQEVLNQSSA